MLTHIKEAYDFSNLGLYQAFSIARDSQPLERLLKSQIAMSSTIPKPANVSYAALLCRI